MAEDDAPEDSAAGVTNEVGTAYGLVVQSRDIHGDVYIHGGTAPPAPRIVAGKPISEWTARELGVHESITLDPAEADNLTCYVRRRHDDEIRGLLGNTAEANLMLVLVGGSASGKTRAAYEALRDLPHLRSRQVVRPTEAFRRGLYRLAARYAVPAAESGDVAAMRLLAVLLELRDATAEADTRRQRAGDLDFTSLSVNLVARLRAAESERLARAHTGDASAMMQLAEHLMMRSNADEAMIWARRAADTGAPAAVLGVERH
jgi:hypothetical protein